MAELGQLTDRELLALAGEHLSPVTDEGPWDEGWKSDELSALCDEIERRTS